MPLISAVISLIILTIIYKRMIRREVPSPIKKSQAVVPVLLGILSTPLSFLLFLAIGYFFVSAGFSADALPAVTRSMFSALLKAGIPEEIAKLLIILLSVHIFRSKIKNVYEYILIGSAVGFGFTLFEEFLYGSDDLITFGGRLLTIAAHMIFGVIMAKHLGIAKHNKKIGNGPIFSEHVKAILIPMAIHTVYDAFTSDNCLMNSESETELLIGVAISLVSIVVLFILQFKVLNECKKNAQKYCDMSV